MTGCWACDLHNHPTLPGGTTADAVLQLHRETHELGRILAQAVAGVAFPVATWAVHAVDELRALVVVGSPQSSSAPAAGLPTKPRELPASGELVRVIELPHGGRLTLPEAVPPADVERIREHFRRP